MNTHETYMNRCLEIAKNGLGTTRPNPMVGSVIVYKNTIIGQGFTSLYGGNHAEVNAINSVKNKALLKEATLYVTLEPCSHFGKTPPCSDLIIKHQIPNVVIGCVDDNIQVAGKGIEKLKQSGCTVTVGVLETACIAHHKRFFTFHNKKRPYIILKWAETLDGFIAPETKNDQKPVWITNPFSRQVVHKWRTEEQAILVGTNTVLEDNPTLTARDWKGQNPTRIVLDKNSVLNTDFNVFNAEAETIVLGGNNKLTNSKFQIPNSKFQIPNTKYQIPNTKYQIPNFKAEDICEALYEHNINSVIIEGGAKTLKLFIDANLWDEARVFTGNNRFNNGVKAPQFSGTLISEEKIMTDILKTYTND